MIVFTVQILRSVPSPGKSSLQNAPSVLSISHVTAIHIKKEVLLLMYINYTLYFICGVMINLVTLTGFRDA